MDPSYIADGNIKWYRYWKTIWHVLKKQKIQLPFWPNNCILGHLSRELKAYVHIKACTWIFIATLFVIVKNWLFLMSISWWMADKNVVAAIRHMRADSAIKGLTADIHTQQPESPENYAEWKRNLKRLHIVWFH